MWQSPLYPRDNLCFRSLAHHSVTFYRIWFDVCKNDLIMIITEIIFFNIKQQSINQHRMICCKHKFLEYPPKFTWQLCWVYMLLLLFFQTNYKSVFYLMSLSCISAFYVKVGLLYIFNLVIQICRTKFYECI